MSSRKRPRKEQQQRLTFEPVATPASSSSPLSGLGLSPARVRFSSPSKTQQESPSRRHTTTSSPLAMAGRKRKPKQQTLESSMGKSSVKKTSKKTLPDEDEDSDDLPLVPSSASKGWTEARRRRNAPPSPRSSAPRSSMFGSHTVGANRRMVVLDSDSESPAEEVGGVADSDGEGPLRQETPRTGRQNRAAVPGSSKMTISSDEDEDEDSESESEVHGKLRSSQSLPNQAAPDDDDDEVLPTRTPRSSLPRRARQVLDEDENEEEEDDVIQTPARRPRPNRLVDDEEEEDNIPTTAKRRQLSRLSRAAPAESESESEGLFGTPKPKGKGKAKAVSKGKGNRKTTRDSSPPPSTARTMRSGARKHRSVREKKMELLRRHKAGEKHLTIEDLDTSEDEDEKGGLYDTDPENEVLSVFDDDEESEKEQIAAPTKAHKKALKKARKEALKKATQRQRDREASVPDEDEEEEDIDFIDDDDDTLGVPDEALHLMPLEFTRSAIKPLKEHFKDAIAWLVHRRINPSFDKNDEVYVRAWRKLSDEITGLANSKYISSVWRPDFHKALKARPYIDQQELGIGSIAAEFESCQACGRSGHPATWSIRPWGKPYDPNTLDEVESDSEDEDEDDDEDDEDEKGDRDFNGNIIPPESKAFLVGQTCNSNAETAHKLMHWKVALRDYVEATLEGEGLFAPDQVLEREQMRPKMRKRLAEEIVARWYEYGTIRDLFGDFQNVIETARNKDTTKVNRNRRY